MKTKNTAEATVGNTAERGTRVQPFVFGLLGGLGVLVALAVGGMIDQLATVLVYVGIALFLALGLDPIVSKLESRVPRPAAVAIVVVTVLLAFAGLLFAIIPMLVEQITNLVNNLPHWIKDIRNSEWIEDITTKYGPNIEDMLNKALSFIQDPSNLQSLGGGALAVGTGIASGVTGGMIVLILTLYFMGSLRGMKKMVVRFIPAYNRTGFADVMDDVTAAVGRYVIGQASLAAINGVLTLILMLILGAPMPALLALFAFIGSCIPLVGTLSASIINTTIVVVSAMVAGDSVVPGIVVGIWYLVYMQVEAYILSPRIMSKAVAVPGALVVIAAVAGSAIGGILGALVAIPVAASVIIIVQRVVFPAQDRKKTSPSSPVVDITAG